MRKRFEQQGRLGVISISEVKLPLKSRDELPPILRALQHIYVTPELNKEVFRILEERGGKKVGEVGSRGRGRSARSGHTLISEYKQKKSLGYT
jgi:hypothetical protein